MDQQIRFCSIATGRIAYAEVDTGPALVLPAWWVSHLELDWESADFRAFVETLAARRRVVRYDPLGTGLSNRRREGGHGGLDGELEALAAVVGAADLGRTALLGDLQRGLLGRRVRGACPGRRRGAGALRTA